MNIKNIDKITDQELKLFFTTEDANKLPNKGIIGYLKKYILSGNKDFTVGEKINKVEKTTMKIVVDRWIKSV